ncbi:MAG TPA: hypothetical protein VFY87_22320, partial [Geminicoccaceae bacterium]|nr:hypothetical protein [Geminicoccaceae bacterium]
MAVGGGPAAAVEAALACFAVAMALHFVVNDYGLDEDHKGPHRRVGRWVLVGAVLVGYLVGAATEISEVAIAALTAFLAGGVILNVLKEEVPSERQGRFWHSRSAWPAT